MKAIFKTEMVDYEVNRLGYTRNGHSVQGQVTVKQLTVGQPAIIECKSNNLVQVIKTDVVTDIVECSRLLKAKISQEVHPYKVSVITEKGKILTLMKIGTESEVKDWVSDRFPNEDVKYGIAPIPLKRKGIIA